jgi:hypothetical protein
VPGCSKHPAIEKPKTSKEVMQSAFNLFRGFQLALALGFEPKAVNLSDKTKGRSILRPF